MADLGKAGGKDSSDYKKPAEGGTPKTGFSSAPKGEKMNFEPTKGFGGSNKGAH